MFVLVGEREKCGREGEDTRNTSFGRGGGCGWYDVYLDELFGGVAHEAAETERLFPQALLLLRRLPLDAGVGSTMLVR